MGDYVETDLGIKVTVGVKPARLGAYVAQDGKVYDLTGRPIEFWKHYDGGMPPPEGMLERADQKLQELIKTCTVIEIFRDPTLPPPV